ncbi:MAG: carboxypeptidase-like regulatory domain-containing protein [Clostridiales bacterium]|nr:carboxypeptidase-like regulatory domain-containing protein [Clostridiales bacterium]
MTWRLALRKKLCFLRHSVLFCFILTATNGIAWSEVRAGAIQGIVTSESGEPIEAATVYLSSPALLGVQIALTEKTGFFDVPGLPPGTYTLTAEKPGFKTVIMESLDLTARMTAFVRIRLPPAEKEEESVVARAPLAGDITSSQAMTVLERTLIDRLPLGRDFCSLLHIAPGVFSADLESSRSLALLGSAWRSSAYRLDGVNITDDFTLSPAVDLDSGIVEELEATSSGQPLSQIPAGGSHVNIITRSGGNKTSGGIGLFFINDEWNKDLWSPSQAGERGAPSVAGVKNHFEPFLSAGGPLWADRAWFFLSSRFVKQSQEDIFIAPFQDVHGQSHSGYDWSRRHVSGFFKLTVRPVANAQVSAWGNFADSRQPVAEDPSSGLAYLSTHVLDRDRSLALHGAGHYFLGKNTTISARASFLQRTVFSFLQEEARTLPWSDDYGDRYGPLNGADYDSEAKLEQLNGEASVRKVFPNWAGLRHILSAGFGYLQTTSTVDWWRENNLLWFLDHRRANRYFYPGEGLVGFWLCGPEKNSTLVTGQAKRLGGYLADAFTIGQHMTIDLSLRLDWVSGGFRGAKKELSRSALSYYVGEAYIKPYTLASFPDLFPNGLNPWGTLMFKDQGDLISWLALSPRLGLVINLLGEGKTLLKASYARTHDDLAPRDLLPLHPLFPGHISFFWLDANGDGRIDTGDEFSPLSFDFRFLTDSFFNKRVADDLRSPVTDEASLGADHFIGQNISLGFRFISRHQKNIPADVLYDPDSGKTWYGEGEGESQKYWIPFTTTVPANGDFPAQTVTVFVRSEDAPPIFRQWRNVPELERKYRAFEFTLEKRMSQGWQLTGTLTLSHAEGNASGLAYPISGLETKAIDPNYFLNRDGRLSADRPVLLKLQASAELPFGFVLSAFYQHQTGRPWERWARILPPAGWCKDKGGERIYYPVNLEPSGSRREESSSFLDGRLEKEFGLGEGSRLCLTVDILNLLGAKRAVLGLNDVDVWEPSAEGEGRSGRLVLAPDYQMTQALLGKRVFRFSFRLTF